MSAQEIWAPHLNERSKRYIVEALNVTSPTQSNPERTGRSLNLMGQKQFLRIALVGGLALHCGGGDFSLGPTKCVSQSANVTFRGF